VSCSDLQTLLNQIAAFDFSNFVLMFLYRNTKWCISRIIKMHGELRLKIVNAKQAELVHRYKNIKTKLLKSNAAISFNKVCRSEQLTPSYIDIKIQ
jgi:hypothetical protein